VVEAAQSDGFVGRAEEMAILVAALADSQAGRGRLVIVGGEAGIGKTALVEHFAATARAAGARVLVGACIEFDAGGPAYGPFVEGLRGLVRSVPSAELPALLGPGRHELARLLPELREAGREPVAAPVPDPTAPARLFELVLGLLERLSATAPLVLVVEDIQWSDPSTRDLLAFLARNLRRASVLVLVTARTEELQRFGPMLPFMAELQRDDHVERIELAAMDRATVAEVLEQHLGERPDAELIESIHARSGGNPFFAEQLLIAAGEGRDPRTLPPRLRDVLLARVASLPEPAREVLRAASAAGRRTDDDLLMAVLDLPDPEVERGFRELIARGIMTDADGRQDGIGGYAFRHALLQEVIYAELFAGQRQRLHAAFGRALAARGEVGGVPVDASELAYHWAEARDAERAVPALIAAGRAAEEVYAFAEARRHYERALSLWDRLPASVQTVPDRVTVMQRAAETAVLSGAYSRAIELGRAAIDRERAAPDSSLARQGSLQERLRWYLWEAGDRVAAASAVEEALRLLPVDPPSTVRARALGHAASLDLLAGRYRAARGRAGEALTVARAVGARAEEALALGVLGWAEAVLGSVEEGIATFREGVVIADELGGVEGIALARSNLSSLLDRVGRTEEALAEALAGFAEAERLGVARTYGGTLLGHAAKALINLGRWEEAATTLDRGLDLDPIGRPAVWLRINQARLDTGRGRFEAAERQLQEARGAGEQLGIGELYHAALLAGIADLAGWRGDISGVRAAEEEAVTLQGDEDMPGPALAWLAAYALRGEADEAGRARAHRDEPRARVALDRGRSIIERVRARRPEGGDRRRDALEALCVAEARRLEDVNDMEAWQQTAAGWDAIRRPFPAAYARFRAAEAALAGRAQRDLATADLRWAHAATLPLGADPLRREIELLARQARIELAAAPPVRGAPPERVGADERFGLTEREHEVLRLVAGGWSNQQIADALYISRKTASVHVSNILGKLQVSSRVEAAAVAHRLGLGADSPPPPDSPAAA
jgi:DNA-binding CsgD family transcriptional regulator/tetratricopeptide (TPR) repeat protein